jgi:hypothetical protein
MAFRNWPLPIRRAIGLVLLTALTLIAFAPLFLLLPTFVSLASKGELNVTWSRLLGGYATLVTVPLTFAIAVGVASQLASRGPKSLIAYLVGGGLIGFFVGLVLSIMTGGYSMLTAPAVGYITFAVFWLIRRPDRDGANPPTSSP